MIPVIQKTTACNYVFSYHEEKVANGEAYLLDSDIVTKQDREGKSKEQIVIENSYSLDRIHDQNDRHSQKSVYKNRYYHLSLSFSPDDLLDQNKMKEVALTYMDKMGYSDRPYYIYVHNDKEFQHLHIVTTTINRDLEKDHQLGDWKKSFKAAREIETDFELVQIETEYGKSVNKEKSTNNNIDKFSFHRSLFFVSDKNLRDDLSEKYPSLLMLARKDQISNAEIKSVIGSNDFYSVQSELMIKEKWHESKRMQLKRKLDTAIELSKNKEEYFKTLESLGVYARELYNKRSQSTEIKYGLIKQGFYCMADLLPNKYNLGTINRLGFSKENHQRNSENKFVSAVIKKTLQRSKNIGEFEKLLTEAKIGVKWASNKGGVYGVSFENKSVEKGNIFKGSEIGYSYKSIIDQINKNNKLKELPKEGLYLQSKISEALKRSTNREMFQTLLYASKISVIWAKNTGGVYGVSFKDNSDETNKTIKGSELKFSLATLDKAFEKNSISKEESKGFDVDFEFTKPKGKEFTPNDNLGGIETLIPSGSLSSDSMDNDPEEEKIKRRRKKGEQDKGKGQSR